MKQLTSKQVASLSTVQDGHVYQTAGRSTRIEGSPPVVVGRLLRMGLIEWRWNEESGVSTAVLTPDDIQALKDNT